MDPHSGTIKSDGPLASRPSVRRKPLRTPCDHSQGTSLQAVPEDTLATPEGESRTSGAEGRGGPQRNMRDIISPTSAATAMPSPQPLRLGSCTASHHGPLNSDDECEHRMWEGRCTAGGSRQALSTPSSNDANTGEGPKGPPSPPFFPSPSYPQAGSLVRRSTTCSSDSANSASEQGSPSIAPEHDRDLSLTPDLSRPPIPSAPQ